MEQPIKKNKFSYFATFGFVHKRSGNEIMLFTTEKKNDYFVCIYLFFPVICCIPPHAMHIFSEDTYVSTMISRTDLYYIMRHYIIN